MNTRIVPSSLPSLLLTLVDASFSLLLARCLQGQRCRDALAAVSLSHVSRSWAQVLEELKEPVSGRWSENLMPRHPMAPGALGTVSAEQGSQARTLVRRSAHMAPGLTLSFAT